MSNIFKPKPWKLWKPPLGTQINPSHPLAQGLIAAWLMNEGGGGNIYDISSNNNTGAFQGSPAPSWNAGQFGSALSFNGSSTYLSNTTFSQLYPLSISVWVNYVIGSDGGVLSFRNENVNPYNGWCLEIFSSTIYFVVNTGASINTTYPFVSGQWTHLALTMTSSFAAILYANGVPIASGAFTTPLVPAVPLYIGSRHDGFQFDGLIDTPLIYNRALSAAEIQQLYAQPFCFMQPRKQLISRSAAPAVTNTYGVAAAGG